MLDRVGALAASLQGVHVRVGVFLVIKTTTYKGRDPFANNARAGELKESVGTSRQTCIRVCSTTT